MLQKLGSPYSWHEAPHNLMLRALAKPLQLYMYGLKIEHYMDITMLPIPIPYAVFIIPL